MASAAIERAMRLGWNQRGFPYPIFQVPLCKPRNVFRARIFHLSPVAIEWLLRDNTHRTGAAYTPFRGKQDYKR